MIRVLQHRFILLLFLLGTGMLLAQTNQQKKLEDERTRLQSEITQIEKLLFSSGKKEKSFEDEIEDLNRKITVREQLIRVTNQQANSINRAIEKEELTVGSLEKEIQTLKKDYAAMINRSYISKSKQSRLMFLLSSKNFYQAYKRMQYLKQFALYRKKQALEISSKSEELLKKIEVLRSQKKQKEVLLAENRKERATLVKEKGNLQNSLGSIRKNKTKYQREIAQKTKRSKAIDAQIEKMIKEAIAAANKKKETGAKNTSNTSTGFVLTAETKRVASDFEANKGKLIWPVAKGIVKRGFGVYTDPVYPEIKHQNNGVIIATEANAEARSIFKGEVVAILRVPGGGLGVQVRHGNYISTYYNLKSVSVSKGDQVAEKSPLGVVSTNAFNGQTQLKFYLYQNTTKLNPQQWIYKL